MLAILKLLYGYEFRDTTSFPEHKFEDSCINNFKQFLSSFQNNTWEVEIEMEELCCGLLRSDMKNTPLVDSCSFCSNRSNIMPKFIDNKIKIIKIL